MGKFLHGGGSPPQPSSRENPEYVGYAGRTLTFQTTGSLESGIYSRNINARETETERKKQNANLEKSLFWLMKSFQNFPILFYFILFFFGRAGNILDTSNNLP